MTDIDTLREALSKATPGMAGMSHDIKRGSALWLGRRLVARVASGETVAEVIDSSRVSPEDPVPQWEKDAMLFVSAVNALPALLDELARLRRVEEAARAVSRRLYLDGDIYEGGGDISRAEGDALKEALAALADGGGA